MQRWPYEVKETLVFTPVVPAGAAFRMGRVIDYQDDCELNYDRRLQSDTPDAKGDIRREVLPEINFQNPPMDLDGKLWEVSVPIPDDFPCGPARIIDSPTAACNWFRRLFWRQRRSDAVTSFTVLCPPS
ncbi:MULTISPECIES: hypothetical protein [Methylobacterium]|uniref:hypothetical protein n=1 Tax=Methylobacterium TaxID=407 RepID=UPI000EC7AEF6|nr:MULTISPECIES: hypothetical protein [Methylobacterium]GBU19040.1 hypothetical protein AwMethylo_32550 [Methylobacterium sp.]